MRPAGFPAKFGGYRSSNVTDRSVSNGSNAFLVTAPVPLGARRRALAVAIALFVVFCALIPFARVPVPRIEAFNPIFESTLALINLVVASFLLVAFRRSRLRAVLCLASGYLFTSLMAIPLILLSSSGPPAADQQTSAWVDTFRNAGLPLFVIGYALRRRYEVASGRSHTGTPWVLLGLAAGAAAVLRLLSLLTSAGHQLLPRLMLGDSYASPMVAVTVVVCLLCLAAAAVIVSRAPYSTLDLWLMVVVLPW